MGESACGLCLFPGLLLLGLYLCYRLKEVGQYVESGFLVPMDLGEPQGSGRGEGQELGLVPSSCQY